MDGAGFEGMADCGLAYGKPGALAGVGEDVGIMSEGCFAIIAEL